MSDNNALSPEIQEQPKCILVVEDDVALRFTLAEWLRTKDYIVYEAASADEAVILLGSLITVHLVVTDIDMPGTMNGLDLVDHIELLAPGMNVILVSGKPHQVHKKNVMFFRKSYDFEAVSLLISKLVKKNSMEPDLE